MRRFHNTSRFVDAVIAAGDRLDPILVTRFINLSMDANQAHLDLIRDTLPVTTQIEQERILCQGAILLSLLNSILGPREI